MEDSFKNIVSMGAILRNSCSARGGGIANFVGHILPYVREAVIVDTGSTDKTYQLLESMVREGKKLRITGARFDGFGQARTIMLKRIRTPWVLMLDDDERISYSEMKKLKSIFEQNKNKVDAFNFDYNTIEPDNQRIIPNQSNPRLFRMVPGLEFVGQIYEHIKNQAALLPREMESGVAINHYVPSIEDYLAKHRALRQRYQ